MATNFASAAKPRLVGPTLVVGFGAAVALWTAWFLTHFPWLAVPENVGVCILLGIWMLTLVAGCAYARPGAGWKVGLGAGLTSSILGLLLLGATRSPQGTVVGQDQVPIWMAAVGFLALGTALGLVGGLVGSAIAGKRTCMSSESDWMYRFALVAVAAAIPLIVVGGLVTSTNSGMAVPDWPGTYGHNMFLFPLAGPAPEATKPYEKIFLEHSHRLFGTLLGTTTLVLMIWVLRAEAREWVRGWAVAIFCVVVFQGVLGAVRVLRDSPATGVIHGILAQVTLASLVALAVFLWATPERVAQSKPFANARRVRVFATAALHTVLLQLVFGATYRHLRELHALWAHIGFSFVVLVTGILGGFWASGVPKEAGPLARVLRRCGWGMVAVVLLQFLLGWAALGMGGREREAPTIAAALIRTVHQANGALLLGLTTATAVLARLLYRQIAPSQKPIS